MSRVGQKDSGCRTYYRYRSYGESGGYAAKSR
jgi:hypothetical protein